MKGENAMRKLSCGRMPELFERLDSLCPLYLPGEKDGAVSFVRYEQGVDYTVGALNTVRSAKDFFFPQVENIAAFRMTGKKIEILENQDRQEPFVVFGVRACDAASFSLLDQVFLSEPVDPYYRDRREAGTVITVACGEPDTSCFCTAFGIDPAEPKGDISVWLTDGFLYWQPRTEKGENLTENLTDILEECDGGEIKSYQDTIKTITNQLPLANLNLSYWKNKDEKEIFASPVWDEIYKGCLGCGLCTFVCPTCQCYDVRDFDCGDTVRKFRCWDSCMYSDFTKMAHGNPRKTQKERFRQRFMHKLKYFPENNGGLVSCVGCGRCVRSCPQGLNIVKTARRVSDD